MAKDWEHYKQDHLESELNAINKWFSYIEKNIDSPIERITYMYLIHLANQVFLPYEITVNPQAKVGKYVVDFMVRHFDTDTWIVVECDGHEYHEKTKAQAAHDKKRDRYFTKENYIVLRYTGSQICENPLEIFDDVGGIIMREKSKKNVI